MATGRKGPSAPSPRRRPAAPPDLPAAEAADDDDGPLAGRAVEPAHLVSVVRGLAAAVAEHGLTELIVDTPDATFTLRRGTVQTAVSVAQLSAPPSMPTMQIPTIPMPSVPMATPVGGGTGNFPAVAAGSSTGAGAPVEEKTHVVTSPFVGTFYRRPNPDAPEYVKVNDKVQKGAVLCIVEAMKLMNEIEADVAGTIVGVLAEDGAPVEYGQPLFKIA